MRINEELSMAVVDLRKLVASTAHNVRRQEATAFCCEAQAAALHGGTAGDSFCDYSEYLSPHVQETLDTFVKTPAEAYGALEHAKGGLQHYAELNARALAALDVFMAVENKSCVVTQQHDMRRVAHKLMRQPLEARRVQLGLKATSPSGVPSAYVKADTGMFAKGGMAGDAVNIEDDDDAYLAAEGKAADLAPEEELFSQVDDDLGLDDDELDVGMHIGGGGGAARAPDTRPVLVRNRHSSILDSVIDVDLTSMEDDVQSVLFTRDGGFLSATEEHPRVDELFHVLVEQPPIRLQGALQRARDLLVVPGAKQYLLAQCAAVVVSLPAPQPGLTGTDLKTLLPNEWLGDEVIHAALNMIKADPRCVDVYVCTTWVWAAVWGESENGPTAHDLAAAALKKIPRADHAGLFRKKRLVIPIHTSHGTHWACACCNFERKRIEYFDPYGGKHSLQVRRLQRLLQALHLKILGTVLDLSDWTIRVWNPGEHIAAQLDGHSCGLIMLYNIISLAFGLPMVMAFGEITRDHHSPRNSCLQTRVRVQLLAELIAQEFYHLPTTHPNDTP
jgi:hypothetical protein